MTLRTVALVGLSGVGKTTLLRHLKLPSGFMHLQASALIQEARNQLGTSGNSAEELRTGPVLDNQALLVSAFQSRTKGYIGQAILDGHVVIDTPNGLVDIPPRVFAGINVVRMVVLQDHPSTIRERRLRDLARKRPDRSELEIAAHQDHSMAVAARIALELDCPLFVLTPRQGLELSTILNVF